MLFRHVFYRIKTLAFYGCCLSMQAIYYFFEDLVYLFDALYIDAFLRAMRVFDGWSDRNRLQWSTHTFDYCSTFKPCMVGYDVHFFSAYLFVALFGLGYEWVIWWLLSSWITRSNDNCTSYPFVVLFDWQHQTIHFTAYRRPGSVDQCYFLIAYIDLSQIEWGLNKSFYLATHGVYSYFAVDDVLEQLSVVKSSITSMTFCSRDILL